MSLRGHLRQKSPRQFSRGLPQHPKSGHGVIDFSSATAAASTIAVALIRFRRRWRPRLSDDDDQFLASRDTSVEQGSLQHRVMLRHHWDNYGGVFRALARDPASITGGGADLVRGPIGGQPHVGRPSVRAAGSFRLLAVHCSPSGVPAEASPTALGCAAARAHPPLFLHCVIRAKPFSVLPTKVTRRQPLLWGTQNGAIHGRFAHKRCAVGVSRPQTINQSISKCTFRRHI